LQSGGILKRVLTESTNDQKPTPNGKVNVDYRGWNYKDSSMFDESRAPDGTGKEFSFDIGKGKVRMVYWIKRMCDWRCTGYQRLG
jgi:FKBP-type peptidyl-prolyl cis-trans isomerase